MANGKTPKPKTCPICSTEYTPRNSLQKVCSITCSIQYAKQSSADKRVKAERKAWRARKSALKPLKHWEDLTQRVVNDYIRERDRNLPCISCGTWTTVQWEAGHFRSRGKASHLRYHEDNIHAQCHQCNVHLSGNQQQYRINLIAKIGAERVEALENNNTPHRYTREELDAIRKRYRALLRELVRARQEAA
ncbi:recombination protein NinG [Enterobacter roggenkampii]|uniref:recombination protein NinG n=1 Tax=Enterobacter roggenkampii TaxID=1812935 RepID=UPI0009419540|nr:recombination protein NinG [Enterobacter roggenkampii]